MAAGAGAIAAAQASAAEATAAAEKAAAREAKRRLKTGMDDDMARLEAELQAFDVAASPTGVRKGDGGVRYKQFKGAAYPAVAEGLAGLPDTTYGEAPGVNKDATRKLAMSLGAAEFRVRSYHA